MYFRAVLVSVLILAASDAFATHYRGGEITYKVKGNYTIEATVTTFTKISYPSNLADRDSVTIDWGDGTTSILPRINGANDSTCTGASPCGQITATDVKMNIYSGVHTYAGAPSNSDYYILSFADDNLLGGIANIDNGNSIDVTLSFQSVVYMAGNYNLFPGGYDASPVFLNNSIYYAFVNEPYTYNPATYDPNGDSLTYALVTPMENASSPVPIYIFPDSFCKENGDANNSFQINATTGEITWLSPCEEGFYQFAIEVSEYRCGLLIGKVMRSIQIIVLPEAVTPPIVNLVHDTVISPGEQIAYTLTSTDTTIYNDSVQVLSGAFTDSVSANLPVFTSNAGNPASGTFKWQPDAAFARKPAYLFTVIATNNYTSAGPDGTDPYPASTTKTFRVWVGDTASPCVLTSVDDIAAADLQVSIFPNPANDILHIQSPQQLSKITVTDISGRQVLSIIPGGANYGLVVTGLEDGVYLLSATVDGVTVARKFVKAE